MNDAMIITMDGAGRIVVPKAIRVEAGLRPGDPLAIMYRDGRIEIDTPPRIVRIGRKGRVAVAMPADGDVEPLTQRVTRRTLDELRGVRG